MISDETRARVDQLVADAPPLTPEQITAAVAILAQPREAAVRPVRSRRSSTSTPSTETRRAAA